MANRKATKWKKAKQQNGKQESNKMAKKEAT